VVLATALLEKLHNHFPDAQIDFLVRKGNEALLTHHPYLHEVLIWDKNSISCRTCGVSSAASAGRNMTR
jgi:ADP-heptose:LPS heptosyltransferase